MLKVYQKFLIKKFFSKYLTLCLIFFCMILIMGILEEISFFEDLSHSIFMPYFLTLINSPSTLFEIFPFIFLLSTQLFFFELLKNDELNVLKKNGLTNLKIIQVLFILVLLIGVFNITIFYNLSSILKFKYTNIKNDLSNDNKYLAMVINSGLWIKDDINDKKFIIKSEKIDEIYLLNTIINEFNNDFELIRVIKSEKINIENNIWKIYNPLVSTDNISVINKNILLLETNFNSKKIKNLFTNISTRDILMLIDLKKDFEKLGYSTDEIMIHMLKLFTMPIFYALLSVLAAILVLNFPINNSVLILIISGILISVIIYYMTFIFSSLGSNGKLPTHLSVFFPMIIIALLTSIGLVGINEK